MTSEVFFVNDHRVTSEILDELLHTPPVDLGTARPRRGPGVYLMTYAGPLSVYDRLHVTGYPIYVGKTKDLSERMRRHRTNLAQVEDIDDRHLQVRWLHTTTAQAIYFEELLHEALRPLWNEAWLTGFGSRYPGRARLTGRTPAWSVLHSGRTVASGTPTVPRVELERRTRDHIRAHVLRYRIWPATRTVIAADA